MKTLKDKVAAITGAGAGIGRATAILMASKGCHIAICDVDEAGLAETAGQCRRHGVNVSAGKVDVSCREQVYAWADEVVRDHGRVNIIFNNAGVALGASVQNIQYGDFEWLMGIDFWGVVYGTKAFLPHIRAAGEGAIVNVSSVLGLIALSEHCAYNSAKFAVRGFTEALRQEMELENAPIGVTCVYPGGVKTSIARSARVAPAKATVEPESEVMREYRIREYEKSFQMTPEKAAAAVVTAILKNKRRLVIGPGAVIIDLMQRLLPAQYQRILEIRSRAIAKKMSKMRSALSD